VETEERGTRPRLGYLEVTKDKMQAMTIESDHVAAFLQEKEQSQETPEERLRSCLLYMQQMLAQEGSPDFRGFWQVRQFCFPLFKESFSVHSRAQLWELYTDLTREGRRLKSLLETEATFAAEQIGLALQDLEQQITALEKDAELLQASVSEIKVPQFLRRQGMAYTQRQQVVNVLNVVSSRIHSLRKELIKTQMRMKQKNHLFQRLSLLGDAVFPRRKDLMKQISEMFSQDVETFMQDHFSESTFCPEKVRRQVFFYRDEIKAFQALAKALTLDTQTFMTTRGWLSQCWDQLKGMEKELKKEFVEHKQQSATHVEEFLQGIEQVGQKFAAGELSADEGLEELYQIQNKMRQVTLVKQDVRLLKDRMTDVSQPMHQYKQEQQQKRREQEEQVELERKNKVQAFQQEIHVWLESISEDNLSKAHEQFAAFRQQLHHMNCHKSERQSLDLLLKQAKDTLMEKQEAAVLQLPHESRQLLEELNQILEVRKERRREIKLQVDDYRKILAGSSLDIEKAMTIQERLVQEKEALEKCDASIAEIEKKIQDLKHRN